MQALAPDLGTILGSLFLSRKRQFDATAGVLSELVYCFALREARGQEVYWTAARGTHAKKTGYCVKTISREYKTLEALGYIEVERRGQDGRGRWQTNLLRPGKRLWEAIRSKARELRRRGFHRGTNMSHKPHTSCDIEFRSRKKAPPGDSSPSSSLARMAQKRLLRLRHRPPPSDPDD